MDSDDELAIVRVRTFLLRKNLTKEMRISRGGFTVREHALVELTTKSGLTGLGEGIGNARSIFHLMKNTVAPVALKWSARDPNGWMSYWSRIPTYFEGVGAVASSVSAFEIAMWDIKGKFFNAPCSELLGGRVREEIPAYASDVYWQSSVDEMRRDAARILSLGFMRIKAHLGVDPPKEETKRVAGLRKEVGEEVDLMIDLNCGYDLREAVEACGRWKDQDLFWLEEPLLPWSFDALASLGRHASGTPISVGENLFSSHEFARVCTQDAADVLMPDVGRVGGLGALIAIAAVGHSHGRAVSPHNFSSGVLLAATGHAMATSKEMNLLEVDTSGNAVYEDLLAPDWVIRNGTVSISRQPGLGTVLPDHVIEQYCIEIEEVCL